MAVEPISPDDLRAIDPLSVVDDLACVDIDAFDGAFREAAKAEDKKGNVESARAFRLYAALSSFHFKPEDKVEPFSHLAAFPDGSRTLMGSDIDIQTLQALEEVLSDIKLLPLQVRIADLLWTRDKSKVDYAKLAVAGYTKLIRKVLDGEGTLRFEDTTPTSISVQDFVQRGFLLARALGWRRAENADLKAVFLEVLKKAACEGGYALVRFGNLGLDYAVEGTAEALADVGVAAEQACEAMQFHEAIALQQLANRVLRVLDKGSDTGPGQLALAKIYEAQADASHESSFLQSHALQQAIDALHGVKGVRDERQRLHDRLKDAQLHFADEMGSFEHSVDISEEVERLLKGYEELDLLDCLRRLALTELPKSPQKLVDKARQEAERYPLSSLFATSILDHRGRTIAKTAEEFGSSQVLRYKVIQHSGISMGLAVSAAILPAREHITTRFPVDEGILRVLCQFSPFVPYGQEMQVARGLQAFLYGDDLVAASLLIPFVEAGLRNLVANAGRSDTTISLGGIEQAIGLGNLLSNHRDLLEKIFGERQIFAIENLFVHELGPKIRHDFCHGMSSDSAFFSAPYVYGCKLVFSLVLLPLLKEEIWMEVRARVKAEFPS